MECTIRGKVDGPTVVFLHGWPDTDELFQRQYELLKGDYRLVSFLLPQYGRPSSGYPDIAVIARLLIDGVELAMSNRSEGPPVMVCHDWGCSVTYEALTHKPNLFSKLVALDIGQHIGHLSLKAKLMVVAYQWLLIFFFLLPSFLGTPLTRGLATILRAPNARPASSRMNFMYLRLWQRLVTRNPSPGMQGFNPPKMPILFMYGTRKPFNFHSERWVDHLNKSPSCRVVPVAADHWFFVRSKTFQQANNAIAEFLKTD